MLTLCVFLYINPQALYVTVGRVREGGREGGREGEGGGREEGGREGGRRGKEGGGG